MADWHHKGLHSTIVIVQKGLTSWPYPPRMRGKRALVMQGIAIVRLLRQLEERTGVTIPDLFDLICGTSTGGILAVALALKRFSLADCEGIYRPAPTLDLAHCLHARPAHMCLLVFVSTSCHTMHLVAGLLMYAIGHWIVPARGLSTSYDQSTHYLLYNMRCSKAIDSHMGPQPLQIVLVCYRNLGQRVFSRPGHPAGKEEDGWKDQLYRYYKSGQVSCP